MRVEPGVGWGEAKLGATMKELVAAFGQPSEEESYGQGTWSRWHALGLCVDRGRKSKKVEQVILYANDPDAPDYAPANVDGALFGQDEDAVRASLGIPRRRATGTGEAWVQLTYDGLVLWFTAGRVVNITIEKRAPANPDQLVSNPELEAAIVAAPDQPAPWLVFGDWLQQQGHPRGAQVAAMGERPFAREQRDDLLGPALTPFADMITERVWRFGFLQAARVASTFDRSPNHDGKLEPVPVADVLSLLLDGLTGRFLRELTIGISEFEENSYGREIGVLSARPRPSIRNLFIGDFESEETELNWSHLGNAGSMWRCLPNLEEVVLRSGSMELGELVLPNLFAFTTVTGGLRKAEVRSIAQAQWPKLERLNLQLGSDRFGSDVTPDDLVPLIKSCPPGLTHLGLTNFGHTDALIPLLASSEVLPRLKQLDLSLGTLGAEGAEALVEHAARFAHLEALDLSQNWLPDEWVDRIHEVLPRAELIEQQDDEGDAGNRYIAAGE